MYLKEICNKFGWIIRLVTCHFFYSMSDTLPTGQLSNVPWRRTGVKYTNNEAYFDVIEEVDVIIDKSGSTVFAEIQGYVRIYVHDSFLLNALFPVLSADNS